MKRIKSTGAKPIVADASMVPEDLPPLCVDGHMAFSATTAMIGATTPSDLATFITLQLYRDKMGIYLAFTPEGAREWAANMLRAADEAEAKMAARANSQLAETLRKAPGS